MSTIVRCSYCPRRLRVDFDTTGTGEVVERVQQCLCVGARRRAGICRDCMAPVDGTRGKALRCAEHKVAARRAQERASLARESRRERKNQAWRDRYHAQTPEQHEQRRARKREWNRRNPEKVRRYKQIDMLRHPDRVLASYDRHNARPEADSAASADSAQADRLFRERARMRRLRRPDRVESPRPATEALHVLRGSRALMTDATGPGISCPMCGCTQQEVIDSRPSGTGIRRRRQCKACLHRFRTRELTDEQLMQLRGEFGRASELIEAIRKLLEEPACEHSTLEHVVDEETIPAAAP